MNTKQVIEQMEKEFDEKLTDGYGFLKDKMFIRDGGKSVIKESKSFIHSYIRTLLESFGEEIINVKKDMPWKNNAAIDFMEKEQRLKVKEIINSIGK